MRSVMRAALAGLGMLVMGGGAVEAQAQSRDPMELGRSYTAWFYAGDFGRLWPVFPAELGEGLGGEAGLRAFREQVRSQLGAEAEVVEERVADMGGFTAYTRVARFEKYGEPVVVSWVFGSKGELTGFSIRPRQEPAPSRFLDYETRTPLHLPFSGEWLVFWGGRSVEENYHAATRDQRFAYDLLVVEDGSSHTGDGTANEQYHCYGREIFAPAAGSVATARDGIPDNRPGVMNPTEPPGNYVVLDHGSGEYSLLAHFQEGSLRVAVGDSVERGDVLGLCGNSGNSSEPHLHYHLQTTPEFGDADGLPAQFLDYIADGQPVRRGEPVQGQRIRPGGER